MFASQESDESEVRDLKVAILEEDVLRFQVSVSDTSLLEVLEDFCKLLEEKSSHFLFEFAGLREDLK